MARAHVVLEGETLATIAAAEGFHDFKKLFDAPENAALRLKRPHPALVQAGDEVVIPDLTPFTISMQPGDLVSILRLPLLLLPQFTPTLDVSTHVESDEDLQLEIRDGGGKVTSTLPKEAGSVENDVIRFTLDPSTLPDPVSFVVVRAGEPEEHAPLAAPADALDDLENNRLAQAAARVGNDAAASDQRVAGAGAGTSASGNPGPALGDVRVIVSFKNPGHRFLKLLQVALTNGAEVPGSRGAGRFVFDALAGATDMSLDVKIPPLGGTVDILNFSQSLTIVRSGTAVTVKEKGSRHPRVRSINMAGRKSAVFNVELDLAFLDVTDRMGAISPSFQTFKQEPKNGCKVVVLEHTAFAQPPATQRVPASVAGDEAFTWAVVVPPAFQQSQDPNVNLWLHFQHELKFRAADTEAFDDIDNPSGTYTNSDEVPYRRLSIYLSPGPLKSPASADASPGPNYVFTDQAGDVVRDPNRNFHWTKQLVDSQKKVVLCLPFPKSVNMGPMSRAVGTRALLRSLLAALQGDKNLGPATPALKLQRMAVSGWSSGTETLVKWCQDTISPSAELGDVVREVYFLDGKNSTRVALTAKGVIEQWFDAGNGNRRLRLIGTANTEAESLALAARKGVTEAIDRVFDAGLTPTKPLVRALPGRDDYFYDSALYRIALNHPTFVDMSLATQAQGLNPTPKNVTDVTTIFKGSVSTVGGFAKAFVDIVFTGGAQPKTARLAGFAEVEAASELFFIAKVPPANTAEFDKIVTTLSFSGDKTEPNRVLKARHPWAPRGGALRNGAFVGYLQFCLEESGF